MKWQLRVINVILGMSVAMSAITGFGHGTLALRSKVSAPKV
ncbi:MAG TPA: hypothetical protein VEK74_07900 [Burkholderiaceae bacterium]|nr:hypothetical protein [Burkholderiaceae bacterium]